MKKIVLILSLVISGNALSARTNTQNMAKKLNMWTGIQIDMNVEKKDRCVYLQLESLYKVAKGFRIAQRRNLKVYLELNFNAMVIKPTEMVGKMTGDIGKIYLGDEYSTYEPFAGSKKGYKVVSRRVVFDNKVYEGEENKNTFDTAGDDLTITVTKADMRYVHHSFFVYRKKVYKKNSVYKQYETSNWADNYRYATDEISALEASDSSKKTNLGKVECGKLLTWFDFGYDAQY